MNQTIYILRSWKYILDCKMLKKTEIPIVVGGSLYTQVIVADFRAESAMVSKSTYTYK